MEGKIAILGDTDFVMPFSALGADTFPVGLKEDEITQGAKKILDEEYALVIIPENIAKIAENVFSVKQNSPTPCVVIVPFTTEPEGFATQALGQALKLATGIDILQSD